MVTSDRVVLISAHSSPLIVTPGISTDGSPEILAATPASEIARAADPFSRLIKPSANESDRFEPVRITVSTPSVVCFSKMKLPLRCCPRMSRVAFSAAARTKLPAGRLMDTSSPFTRTV